MEYSVLGYGSSYHKVEKETRRGKRGAAITFLRQKPSSSGGKACAACLLLVLRQAVN